MPTRHVRRPWPALAILLPVLGALLSSLTGPVSPAAAAEPCGIFVATTGADTPTAGLSPGDPCRTLAYAMARAQAVGLTCLFVQAGTYAGPLALVAGMEIHGGFDSAWVQAPWSQAGHLTALTGGYESASGQHAAVVALNLASPVVLSNLKITAPDAVGVITGGHGRSSYGVYARGSSQVVIDKCHIVGGQGAVGQVGADGVNASQTRAQDGAPGTDGIEANYACDTEYAPGGAGGVNAVSGANGGLGGSGGSMDTSCGWTGVCDNCNARPGTSGQVGGGANPGAGGPGANVCVNGPPGGTGSVNDGAGGSSGSGGQITSQSWCGRPGGAGSLGTHGSGGGGGGGGGGCDNGIDSRGGGGGGGGAGGARATAAGQGGGGGGGSIGVFGITSGLEVTDCVFERDQGGSGGAGGAGALGQPGGYGGPGGSNLSGDPGNGGAGGNGTRGGHSGGGGGGAGGSSYGICVNGSTLVQSGNVFSGGSGGNGGAGGGGTTPGSNGVAGSVAGVVVVSALEAVDVTAVETTGGFAKNACDPVYCPVADASGEVLPSRVALLPNVPNPFNPLTEIRFELPAASAVDLEVHDVNGRLVRRLLAGAAYTAGRHHVAWNGWDDEGRAVASGLYLVKLRAGAATEQLKVMLLR